MDAIILAGGLGKRLRQTVADIPKPLAPIRGRPFLDLLLGQLEEKVDQIILAIGYKAEQIKAYYHSGEVIFSEETTPLGTGGALKQALRLAQSPSVLVLNGDSYFGIDFQKFFSFHQNRQAHVTIACREVEDVSRYGSLCFDENQRVNAFHEKKTNAANGWINGGIYLMNRDLLESFPEDPFSLEHEGFPSLLNKRIFVYPSKGLFIDIGTKESYLEAQHIL